MRASQQFDIIGLATSVFMVTGVAVMMSRAMEEPVAAPPFQASTHNSIPWEAKKPLVEKYGLWAVNRAEAICPHNDVACVEREARRALEVYRQRRQI